MGAFEEAFYGYVSADADVVALVEDRVYPVRGPEGVGVPYVSWFRVSADRTYDHDPYGLTSPWVRARVQTNCWAYTADAAFSLGEAVIAALSGFSGDWDGRQIASVTVLNESERYETDSKLYRRIIDFRISYHEAEMAS